MLPDGTTMAMKQVKQLELLGVMLDGSGSTAVSLEHRMGKAEACFWINAKAFLGPGTLQEKLTAWQAAPAASHLFGADS